MKLKKAMLALVCALALVVGSVMGTMAYLTDTKTVTNTFTVGDVQIKLDETDVVDGGRTEEGNQYKLLPNQTYTKDPTVTVISGSEKSYVRMLVTIDKQEALDAIFDGHDTDLMTIFNNYDASKWELVAETENNDDTRTYEFRYTAIVDASAAEVKLEPLFSSITVPGFIDNDELSSIEGMTIKVVAHAIQSAGFADANAAWTAFDAE